VYCIPVVYRPVQFTGESAFTVYKDIQTFHQFALLVEYSRLKLGISCNNIIEALGNGAPAHIDCLNTAGELLKERREMDLDTHELVVTLLSSVLCRPL
jgi:hypothetical protein